MYGKEIRFKNKIRTKNIPPQKSLDSIDPEGKNKLIEITAQIIQLTIEIGINNLSTFISMFLINLFGFYLIY